MKKSLLVVILLAILPFIFIFSNSAFFYTQDGWTHLARGGAFYKALEDGQFPVRWARDLNYGYGMPLFNFVFHFPYYVMSLFIFLGFGLVNALKATTFLSFFFSGIFMYLFAKEFFKDERKALLVTCFYQFFPFRLVEMFVRGSIGEMFAFTFLPLILYGIVLSFNKFFVKALLIISLGTAGLVLSHLATGFVFLLISAAFAVVFADNIRKLLIIAGGFILGLGISAYYWIPAVVDHKYTYGSLFAKDLYKDHFAPLQNFFLPNFLNDPNLRIGDVPIQVGLFHIVALVVALSFLVFTKHVKNIDKKLILFSLSIVVISFFIMQPVSRFIWEHVPLFEQFQFPWRFLGATGLALSLLAVYFLFTKFGKNIFILLVCLVVGTTAYYWYPQLGFRTINEKNYWNYPLDTTYFGETNLIWSAGPASKYPLSQIEVIGGEAVIGKIEKQSNKHTFHIDAKEESQVVDHTQFFPGWKVIINGQDTSIQFQDPNNRGEITFMVPKGSHSVAVIFGETKMRLIADTISLVSLFVLFGLIIQRKFIKKFVL